MLRELLHPSSWLVILLGLEKRQRYRRWWGGHWELWWIDVCCSQVWHDVPECSQQPKPELPPGFWKGKSLDSVVHMIYRDRPTPLCRGTPTCEDYTKPDDLLDAEFIG